MLPETAALRVVPTAPHDQEREFAYTDADFQKMRGMLNRLTGITLQERGREMVYNRLARRLRVLELDSVAAYISLVEGDGAEARLFADSLTTNTTSFFREDHHFTYLSDVLIPGWIDRRSHSKKVRIWSAACSFGQEPYTLAMVLMESDLRASGFDVRILATDIDGGALETARAGIYRADDLKEVSAARQKRWFRRGTGAHDGQVRVAPELKQIITFNHLNLMDPWPVKGPFDLILCRNVYIYFASEVCSKLTTRFGELLPAQGILMLGHSESIVDASAPFESLGKTIYRRQTA